jgi:hypothetical protein
VGLPAVGGYGLAVEASGKVVLAAADHAAAQRALYLQAARVVSVAEVSRYGKLRSSSRFGILCRQMPAAFPEVGILCRQLLATFPNFGNLADKYFPSSRISETLPTNIFRPPEFRKPCQQIFSALPNFGNLANKYFPSCRNPATLPTKMESLAEIRQDPPHLFSFVQKSGKAAGIYFASGGNQDSVISVSLPLLRRPAR